MRHSRIVRSWILSASAALLLLVPAFSAAEPVEMSKDEIICLAQSGVGFSYWWGHDTWCGIECAPDFSCPPRSCSNPLPGTYGSDCSGFVAKVWQVPNPIALSTPSHPLSTQNFYCQTTYWSRIERDVIDRADAFVTRDGCPGEEGHVMLHESHDAWGNYWTYEARNCTVGIVHNNRTVGSSYRAIRRNLLAPDCIPAAEVCDGVDNDCDGSIDEDYVPVTCGLGICERSSTCEGGSESCSPGLPKPEVCDGLDNDCNGKADERDVCAVPEAEEAPEPDLLFPEGGSDDQLSDAGAPNLDGPGVTGGCGCLLAG